MTVVYARIAETKVAEQYYNATSAVEADAAVAVTAEAVVNDAPANRRLLANGTAPGRETSTVGSRPSARAAA
ncbi:MAG: hypothetical protein ACRDZN_02820, partial [Acidimicrobiales bacterium]